MSLSRGGHYDKPGHGIKGKGGFEKNRMFTGGGGGKSRQKGQFNRVVLCCNTSRCFVSPSQQWRADGGRPAPSVTL